MILENVYAKHVDLLAGLARLPRHLVSDGMDQAVDLIVSAARGLGLEVICHEYHTGAEVGTWIVPEKWTLGCAQLRDCRGRVLLDAADEPLTVMSYSAPCHRRVGRDELLAHLHTHPNLPDAVPFVYRYYGRRDWGLCCSERFKQSLVEDEYEVIIESEFSAGVMTIVEVVVPGRHDESFVMASHLCHPGQLNDGPIALPIWLEILNHYRHHTPNHSMRLLTGPEMVGTAAWLSTHRKLIPKLKGGLFAEMITIDLPFTLHASFQGDTLLDRLFWRVVSAESPDNRRVPFSYSNDERQFNGPNVGVPMLALTRSNMAPDEIDAWGAFPQYHSSRDDLSLVTPEKYDRAAGLIWRLVEAFDKYLVRPRALFAGEPFLSRYGLSYDCYAQEGAFASFVDLMDVVYRFDGRQSVFEIADQTDKDPEAVWRIALDFSGKGLLTFNPFLGHRRPNDAGLSEADLEPKPEV